MNRGLHVDGIHFVVSSGVALSEEHRLRSALLTRDVSSGLYFYAQ